MSSAGTHTTAAAVTGASFGIGLAACLRLLSARWTNPPDEKADVTMFRLSGAAGYFIRTTKPVDSAGLVQRGSA